MQNYMIDLKGGKLVFEEEGNKQKYCCKRVFLDLLFYFVIVVLYLFLTEIVAECKT